MSAEGLQALRAKLYGQETETEEEESGSGLATLRQKLAENRKIRDPLSGNLVKVADVQKAQAERERPKIDLQPSQAGEATPAPEATRPAQTLPIQGAFDQPERLSPTAHGPGLTPPTPGAEVTPDIGRGVARGTQRLPSTLVSGAKAALDWTGMPRYLPALDLAKAEKATEELQAAPRLPSEKPAMLEQIAENVPQLGAVVLATLAGGLPAGASVAWASEAGAAYQEAKESGASEKDARDAAMVTGTANALLEYLPVARLVSAAGKPATNVLKNTLRQAIAEGTTETFQEANSVLAALAIYQGESGLTWEEIQTLATPETLKRLGTAGFIGAVLGGGAGGVAGALQSGGPSIEVVTAGQQFLERVRGNLPVIEQILANQAEKGTGEGGTTEGGVGGEVGEVVTGPVATEATTEEVSEPVPGPEVTTQEEEAQRAGRIVQSLPQEIEEVQRLLARGEITELEAEKRLLSLGRVTQRITDQPLSEMAARTEEIGTEPSVAPTREEDMRNALETLGIAAPANTDQVLVGEEEVPVRWQVVEADQLQPSHVDTGTADRAVLQANPAYDPRLQPRERTRQSSESQVTSIADRLDPRRLGPSVDASQGAPVVGEDLQVESGNARTIGIQRAYRLGSEAAQRYRREVEQQASQRGLSTEGMRAPVLVRVRPGDLPAEQRQELTRRMNEPPVARMAPAEQARPPMTTTTYTLYRGQTGRWDPEQQDGLSWWVAVREGDDDTEALEMAASYGSHDTDAPPEIYRARLSSTAIRGENPEFDNAMAGLEGADEWLSELLTDQGADYLMHSEGSVLTVGIRPDRLAVVESLERLADQDDPWDGWEPVEPEGFVEQRPEPEEPVLVKASETGAVEIPAADAKRWLRKWWTTPGLLPKDLHEVRRSMHHQLAAWVEEIEYLGRELRAKARRYKGPLTKPQLMRYLDSAYRGMNIRQGAATMDDIQIRRISKRSGVPEETIRERLAAQEFPREAEKSAAGLTLESGGPGFAAVVSGPKSKGVESSLELAPEFLPLVARIRAATDAMARTLRRQGLLTDGVARELERHHGLYVNRAYKAFNDPKWKERVREEPMWRRFADILSAQLPEMTQGQIEGMMGEYVDRIGDAPPALPGGVIEGSKQMGPLRQRKGMEDMRRLLLGEYRDIRANYANTMAHMAQIIEAHRMLTEMERIGKGKYFLERSEVREGVRYEKDVDPAFYKEMLGKVAQGRVPLQTRASGKARSEAGRLGVPLSIVRGSGVGGRVLLSDVERVAERLADDPGYAEVEPVPTQGTKPTPSGQRGMPRTTPLSGLYTSPEILEDLQEDLKGDRGGSLYRAYMKLNYAVKLSKTALSIGTTTRNLLSNSLYLVANGHSPIPFTRRGVESFRTAFSTVWGDIIGKSDEELLRIRQEFISLGIMGQSTDIGDLQRIAREGKLILDAPAEKFKSHWRIFLQKVGDFYQSMDDFPKLLGYGAELEAQRRAYPDRPDKQLKREAARIVRDTMQNYGELPRGVTAVSRNPIVAPFFSFGAELVRNAKNIGKQAALELKSDNEVIRARGRQRVLGMVVAATLPEFLKEIGMMAWNFGGEEEEALRRFVYEWDRESSLQIWEYQDGRVTYFDWGWLDVWARLKEPVMAMLRSDPEDPRLKRAWENVSENVGEEILLEKVLDVARNKSDWGGEIYNEQAPWAQKLTNSAKHVGEALEPGTVRSGRRIWQAIQGVVLPSGKALKPMAEIVALAGPRFVTIDIREAIGVRGRQRYRDLSEATSLFTREANTRGTPDKKKIIRRYRQMQEARLKILRGLRYDIQAAETLGVPPKEVDKALRQREVPQKYIVAARLNRMDPRPWRDTTHGRLVDDELKEIFLEYRGKELED